MSRQLATAWTFASSSDPRKFYQTLRYTDGSSSCDCAGWTRRCQPDGSRTCRHTRDVEMGMADRTSIRRQDYGNNHTTQPRRVTPHITQPELIEKRKRHFDLD
jgi:hypothetical protein